MGHEDDGVRRIGWRDALVVLLLAALGATSAGAAPLLRISLENAATHVQAQAVKCFVDDLAERTDGRLEVQVFTDARLFRDRDVVPALVEGHIEMAVPGTWQLDRFVPAVGIPLLPAFYGRDAAWVHARLDGPLGREIDRRIESGTGAVVLGRWIDLGPVHVLGVGRRISRHEDLAGMTVRIAGGVANQLRLEVLGAKPVIIAWPDLPARLAAGEVQGVLTSYETVASARLWEAGIRSALEDAQYFGQYVPLVAPGFWNRLPEPLRREIGATWEEHVEEARRDAARSQEEARALLIASGVRIAVPTAAEAERWRQMLAVRQPDMIKALGLDAELARLVPSP